MQRNQRGFCSLFLALLNRCGVDVEWIRVLVPADVISRDSGGFCRNGLYYLVLHDNGQIDATIPAHAL